ncbi:MAG: hypothetical protein GY866_01100 [Proteobacteria bacterium]|nr:hypothetical protein [Pseudomonadota bacterium]
MKALLNRFPCLVAILVLIGVAGCSSSLHEAARMGEISEMQSALDDGIDVDEKNLVGSTPLHIAAENGRLDSVEYLVSRGGSVHSKNSYFETPLHSAVSKGHLEIVAFLVSKGANVHTRNNHGNTPLILASQEGRAEIANYLISKGASVSSRNNYQESARYLALKGGHSHVVSVLNTAAKTIRKTPARAKTDRPTFKTASVLDRTAPKIEITSPDNASRGFGIVEKNSGIRVAGKATDGSGVAEVTINGVVAGLDRDGRFEGDVFLRIGENRIEVTATDIHANQATRTIQILRPSPAEIDETPFASGNYHALIIGNNEYRHLPKLGTAKNDAVAVDRLLREQFGFRTTLVLDATKTTISRALNQVRKQLGEDDNLLIYYAGHGFFDSSVNKAYWWPVDAEQDDDTNWIIADTITANIQRISSRHVLVVADSCYSGTLTRSAEADLSTGRIRAGFLDKMSKRPSRTLMASGGNEPVADGGGGRHSIFAAAFLRALREKTDTVFTAEELFYDHIKETVAGKSAQVPVYSVIRNSGHDGGDFVFKRK